MSVKCPLLRLKRTLRRPASMSPNDPFRTSSISGGANIRCPLPLDAEQSAPSVRLPPYFACRGNRSPFFGSQEGWPAMSAAIIKYLLIFAASLGSCIVIVIWLHDNSGRSIDSLNSPDGTAIVEKINCDEPYDDDWRISIRGAFENCQNENHNAIRIRDADSVGFVWLDNGHLLVAAPSLGDIKGRPARINNIAISYSVYSLTEPTEVRDTNEVSASTVSIIPNYKFRPMDIGLYVGCDLFVSANLPSDRKLGLRVFVQKALKTKAWAGGQIVDIPEGASAYLQFSSVGDFEFPNDWATSAMMRDVGIERGGPDAGQFTEFWSRDRFAASLPSGSSTPPTQDIIFAVSELSLQMVLDKLRSGHFEIDFGYWFSNKKATYVSSKGSDTKSIDEFVGCLRTNEVDASVH